MKIHKQFRSRAANFSLLKIILADIFVSPHIFNEEEQERKNRIKLQIFILYDNRKQAHGMSTMISVATFFGSDKSMVGKIMKAKSVQGMEIFFFSGVSSLGNKNF